MAKKAKSTKIKINQLSDDNSVKVTIGHNYKMSTMVDKLIELSDESFKEAIKVARKYRRANKSMDKYLSSEGITIKIESENKEARIVNGLVDLGNKEFRQTVRCARKYRRANKALDNAIHGYVQLKKQDQRNIEERCEIRRMGLAYEG